MRRMTGAAVLVGMLSITTQALAQGMYGPGMGGASAGMPSPAGALNPLANPLTNPFINPYMTQVPMQRDLTLYYLMSTQQANGGLGSGRLSGVHPGPGTATGRNASAARAAEAAAASGRRQSDVPGSGAAGYFNRSTGSPASMSRYYNRQGRYYPANAH